MKIRRPQPPWSPFQPLKTSARIVGDLISYKNIFRPMFRLKPLGQWVPAPQLPPIQSPNCNKNFSQSVLFLLLLLLLGILTRFCFRLFGFFAFARLLFGLTLLFRFLADQECPRAPLPGFDSGIYPTSTTGKVDYATQMYWFVLAPG